MSLSSLIPLRRRSRGSGDRCMGLICVQHGVGWVEGMGLPSTCRGDMSVRRACIGALYTDGPAQLLFLLYNNRNYRVPQSECACIRSHDNLSDSSLTLRHIYCACGFRVNSHKI